MGANKVDILFVVDASDSMSPCFQKLRDNLRRFILPLRQASFEIRFGLLAYNAGGEGNRAIYEHTFIGGNAANLVKELYSPNIDINKFFTNDANKFLNALDSVRTQGDENTPLALDIASDFPFNAPNESRRVIALFSNERLETGILEDEPLAKFQHVLQKIVKRKIALYAYLPASNAAALMTRLPKSIITSVEEGPNCWDNVDFGQMLEQMGKSISTSTLQMTREPEYQKAIYGQDTWDSNVFVGEGDARREKILATGESAKLNMSKPLEWIHANMLWDGTPSLYLLAVIQDKNRSQELLKWGKTPGNRLGDALVEYPIPNYTGQTDNSERITITSLKRINKLLILTKLFGHGDFEGNLTIETSNGDKITVPVTMKSASSWNIVAKIDNTEPQSPLVKNINTLFSGGIPNVEEF